MRGSQDVAPLSTDEVKSFFGQRDANDNGSRPAMKSVNVGAHGVRPSLKPTVASKNENLDARDTLGRTPSAPTKSIADYTRDELIEAILSATIENTWHEREDVLIVASRGLGFARVGRNIRAAFKSAFNGAIRRGLLESEGSQVHRAQSSTRLG